MFERVLIARRGEVAARVARSCKKLGIEAIALHSDATDSVHVRACDRACQVSTEEGEVPAAEVLRCAQESGAEAVFPGYASQRPRLDLARLLEAAAIPFVGVDPDVLLTVGDRVALRELCERAEVPMVPGGSPDDLEGALTMAEQLGYPLVVKCAEASSGVGRHVAHDPEELPETWQRAAALAGERPLVVETLLERARDIEMLVASDSHGNTLPLIEMETSVLANGRGVIRESPSPELVFAAEGEAIREMMVDVAIRVARELACVGVMSVQMLITPERRLYVRGARLGIPALHAVAERVLQMDLVALQLEVASGEALPESVGFVQPHGHAAGAQILATDDAQRSVAVETLIIPSDPRARLELSVGVGQPAPPDDWPRLAKVTTSAPIRREAILTLDRLLAGIHLDPLTTNLALLRRVLHDETFRAGHYDLALVDRLLAAS